MIYMYVYIYPWLVFAHEIPQEKEWGKSNGVEGLAIWHPTRLGG